MEISDRIMTWYLAAAPDCRVLCCESLQCQVITRNSRLDLDDFSPQSARCQISPEVP